MSTLNQLLASFDGWRDERSVIAEQDGMAGGVSSSTWQASDDDAFNLLEAFAEAVRVTLAVEPDPPEVLACLVVLEGDEDETTLVLVCPHAGCVSRSFYEIDQATRNNDVDFEEPYVDEDTMALTETRSFHHVYPTTPNVPPSTYEAEVFGVHIYQGDGNFETTGHACQGCGGSVTLPVWLDVSWS